MIDTSDKYETFREAKAEARVKMSKGTLETVKKGAVPKGNVLEMARTAGVLAAKKTSELIPLCHPLPIDFVGIDFEIKEEEIVIRSDVRAIWRTGVEMEALMAASVAALTIYDMLKPLDQHLVIENIVLFEKKGGKSDFLTKYAKPLRAGVLVISDSTFQGKREDKSGKIICRKLEDYSIDIKVYKILPDNKDMISQELKRLSDEEKLDMIFTSGGTGLGPKDITPEATAEVIERTAPGLTEAMRNYGQKRTPYSMLSRNISGVRGLTLIVNLPGSSRGAKESMDSLLPGIFHAIKMIRGGGHDHQKSE